MSATPATTRGTGIVDSLPLICGTQAAAQTARDKAPPVFLNDTDIDLGQVRSAFAVALHMHQPTIPAGGNDLQTAGLIGHLQWMFEHPDVHDNHNAGPFARCYERMGDFIPQLVEQGKSPRVMLDYSGTLLWGLEQMGRGDVLDKLARITCDPTYRRHVEWLGTMWGHAVASSTPPADIPLHLAAWKKHFAALFGSEALARVRGFSPPEMHLPNEPDVAYAYVRALLEAGFTWLLVQEHSVENVDGSGIQRPHLPHRLIARNSLGDSVSITALVKTQGSDNKLVAQMQPLAEARGLGRLELGGVSIPPLVSQIGDGENGGVMMNEFPQGFLGAYDGLGTTGLVPLNGTEYLELIEAAGVKPEDYIPIQPIHQHAIWSRMDGQEAKAFDRAVAAAKIEVPNFHLDGGSWTNSISWVRGYDGVLDPMNRLSADFHERLDGKQVDENSRPYREALLYLLLSQTSCFRYWGEGRWGDYARELCRRGTRVLDHDF
jgi:hypothetical protein